MRILMFLEDIETRNRAVNDQHMFLDHTYPSVKIFWVQVFTVTSKPPPQ